MKLSKILVNQPLRNHSEVNSNLKQNSKVLSPSPLTNPRKGDYLLNRTHSTEGIASKLSLELKKRYLLGGSALGGSVMKSGSASNVDTKLRSFTDSISQHQKLLNPAPEPSPTMQAFLQGTKLGSNNSPHSPLSPTILLTAAPTFFPAKSKIPSIDENMKSIDSSETSKTQLPDLVKETSIFKSKTDPNISYKESLKDENIINEDNRTKEEKGISEERTSEKSGVSLRKLEDEKTELNQNENDCRPRSPLHETSIIVPQVDWRKKNKKERDSSEDSEIDSDSLSSSDIDLDVQVNKKKIVNLAPPRLQIHSTNGDLLLDETNDKRKEVEDLNNFEPDSIECIRLDDKPEKVVTFESPKDVFSNQCAKEVEVVDNNLKQLELQDERKSACSSPTSIASISNKEGDSDDNDVTTAAYTETEYSEWARDGEAIGSEDIRDVELSIDPEFISSRKSRNTFNKSSGLSARIAKEEDDLTDVESETRSRNLFPNNDTSKLLANGEDLDFMDTDNESLLDDSLQEVANNALLRNRGYVEFVNFKASTPTKTPQRTVNAPIAKTEIENDDLELDICDNENVIEINPVTMDDVRDRLNGAVNKFVKIPTEKTEVVEEKNKEMFQSMEEDSLLIVEPTEDTTTSELITVLASPINPKLPTVPTTPETPKNEPVQGLEDSNNTDYLEYVKRLQSRIAEFSNAKDSIDVRKSKRKNSKPLVQIRTAEMIAEEIKSQESYGNNYNSPATCRKLEEITRERSKQKNLIQDILMDKLEAHKQKSAEKKAKRAARASSFSTTSLSPVKASISSPSVTPIKFVPMSIPSPSSSPTRVTFAEAKKTLFSVNQNIEQIPRESKTLSVFKPSEDSVISTPRKEMIADEFKTPIAPPRAKHEEAKRTAEKAKQDARERARLKSDEDLGLSPEDKIRELRMKVARRQFSTEEKKKPEADDEVQLRHWSVKPGNRLQTSKSTDNFKGIARKMNFESFPAASNAKSMDELLQATSSNKEDGSVVKRDKKKSKDPERRKSIIQAVSDFFKRKDPSLSPSSPKDKLSMFRLTPKSKEKGKVG